MAYTDKDLVDVLKYHIEVDRYGTHRYYNGAGQLHREDGPAIITVQGSAFWYQCGLRHRTDGPAIEYSDGGKEWWQNGQRHRTDGPAIVWDDGSRQWFLYGREYTESAFHEKLKKLGPCNDH